LGGLVPSTINQENYSKNKKNYSNGPVAIEEKYEERDDKKARPEC